MARDHAISRESIRMILADIVGMKRVLARSFSIKLNFFQKEYRKQFSLDLLERANSDPTFMESIISGNETCKQVNNHRNQTRFQSNEEIQQNSLKELKAIPRRAYEKYFEG